MLVIPQTHVFSFLPEKFFTSPFSQFLLLLVYGSFLVQFSLSVVSDSLRPHESQHARPPCVCITNSWGSLRLTSIESVMPSSHLILCRPLLLLPPIPPSIRVFSNESTLHMRWPKYGSFCLVGKDLNQSKMSSSLLGLTCVCFCCHVSINQIKLCSVAQLT